MKNGLKKVFGAFSQIRHSFLAVIVLIQALLITLSVLFARMTIEILDQTQEDKHKIVVSNIYNNLAAATEKSRAAIAGIIKNKAMISAFAQRDRAKLFEAGRETWLELQKSGFKQFAFHSPDSKGYVTFLRIHEPEKFGENLDYRPMVVRSNLKKELLAGLEQGKSGYGFRVVAPIFADGNHIGSVELGSSFGETFLEELNKDFPGNWAIYNLDRGISSVDDRMLVATLGKDIDGDFKNLLPDSELLETIKKDEVQFLRSRAANMSTMYVPVKNFQGDIALFLKYVYPSSYFKRINKIIITATVLCLVGLAFSILILQVLHSLIADPVRKLVRETQKIRDFQLDDKIEYSSSLKEMNELIESTRSMKAGLQSFRKYVPADLVRQLIEAKQEAVVGGQRRNITVFFSDVAGFTTISESLTPNELTAQLSEYFSVMTEVISKHKGTVDKYIGDAVMAFWGAPVAMENHAELACLAALECQKRCAELNLKWQREGKQPFITRIGINSGEIIVGNMGSSQRLNYTIIGDEVNLASRLEGLNRSYGTQIMVSQNTVALLPSNFALRLLDFVVVKGKTRPVSVYELVAEKGDVTSFDLDFIKDYNQAIDHYKQREWDDAIELWQDILSHRPKDLASEQMIKRCEQYKLTPPPEKWKGEFFHSEK
jgi:class 3 adenylate cyclase